jgi:hypothetical protein
MRPARRNTVRWRDAVGCGTRSTVTRSPTHSSPSRSRWRILNRVGSASARQRSVNRSTIFDRANTIIALRSTVWRELGCLEARRGPTISACSATSRCYGVSVHRPSLPLGPTRSGGQMTGQRWQGLPVIGAMTAGAGAAVAARGGCDDDHDRDRRLGGRKAPNVICFIGDGMGVSTLTATRVFSVGVDGHSSSTSSRTPRCRARTPRIPSRPTARRR